MECVTFLLLSRALTIARPVDYVSNPDRPGTTNLVRRDFDWGTKVTTISSGSHPCQRFYRLTLQENKSYERMCFSSGVGSLESLPGLSTRTAGLGRHGLMHDLDYNFGTSTLNRGSTRG